MTLNPRHRLAAGTLCLLLVLPAVPARAAEAPPLTLEQIMADPDWIGNPPEDAYWGDDGRAVYYEREREGIGEQRTDLFRVDLATGKTTRIEPAEYGKAGAPGGELSRDRKRKVYERAGDIFVRDLKTGAVRQITRTGDEESDPHFLADGKRVWFRRDKEVFVYDLESGLLSQPAALKLEKDPAEKDEPTPLAETQTRLFDVIRQKQEQEERDLEEERTEQRADPTRSPLAWYLGKEITIEQATLSPAGDWLLVVTAPKQGESDQKPSKLAQFVTESGNVETREVRAKVGTEKPVPHSVILLDLKEHKQHDLDWSVLPGAKDDPLKALREAAKARKAAAKKRAEKPAAEQDQAAQDEGEGATQETETKEAGKEEKDDTQVRPLEVLGVAWSEDGRRVAIQLRARDNKDRWLATFDTRSGELTPRHRLTDPAWINWIFNDFGWLPDNETIFFLSEESGYSRLYLLSVRTGEIRPLTPEGRYEVSTPGRSWDGRHIYYVANREHPGNYDVWRIEVATAKAEQLTRLDGLTEAVLSPDESQLLLVHSSITRPDEL
ncbi:MAG TPA: DPP IV N-terminal domain-containing protein [Thermoanaerobaculia bacterium]|jgi:dipeptidyl aminopeptidase/acylaminoacyl peptidase